MSILQDILSSGHVEPELLDALDEEQKAMLFIQMRQEQVRKWLAAEEELELDPPRHAPKKKNVKWLLGQDNNVWTWVMGEHAEDKTIEEMLEEEAREEARERARQEVELQPEEELKAQLGSLRVGASVTDSMYDDADAFFSSPPLLLQPPSLSSHMPPSSSSSTYPPPSSSKHIHLSPISPLRSALKGQPQALNTQPSFVTSALSYGTPTTSSANPSMDNDPGVLNGSTSPMVTATTVSSYSTPLPETAIMGSSSRNGGRPPPPAVPARPSAALLRNKTLLQHGMSDEEWQKTMHANGVKMRAGKSRSPEEKSEEIRKRESEIFQSIQDHREQLKIEAEAEAEKQRIEWEQQERKSREAEAAIRSIAQRAREQHRALQLRTSTSILPALKDTRASSLREAIKSLPRPPKPKNRQAIVEWFRKEELPKGTGLDPKTKAPAPWFHGIISRQEAEDLLREKPTGSFLVRVSERIWGYTVSYVVSVGQWKHFLVEKILDGYQFLGTNQVVHEQLFDLVSYHESAPITVKGNEILKWSVGQIRRPPDYSDLLPEYIGNGTNGAASARPMAFRM